MTEAEPSAQGFLVDTSVCRKQGQWARLCKLARQADRRVFISAITLGEMIRSLRERKREEFALTAVKSALKSLGVTTLPVDDGVAECFAERVHRLYPTRDDWNGAKQRLCHAMLHLGTEVPLGRVNPRHHCSATNDWFIAATAAAHSLTMVTEDEGEEFAICERVSLSEAFGMLGPQPPSGGPTAP